MELEDRSEEATTPFEGIQDAQARPSEWIGFRKTGRIINLSYDKIAAILHSQVPRQHGFRPDFVVGIARGGILPASIVASNLRVPLYLIQVTRGSAPVSWTYAPGEVASSSARRPRALLVDDIASSGQTLLKAKGFLESAGMIVCTNTVFYDQRTALRPDIGSLALDYVRFPWERRENTPGSMQKKRAGSADAFHFLDEEDFFGFDLDGVFLDDVPAETYARQLEAALSMRDALQLLESSPRIALSMRKRAAIVTGRPQMDYDRTRQWLDRYGMHDIALYCRDHLRYGHDEAGAIASKIETINTLGISCFVESELRQAVMIARGVPSIDVVWWNSGVNPLRVSGHDFDVQSLASPS